MDTDDTLTYSIEDDSSYGKLGAINGNTVVYTPSEHFNGIDTFTYKANDGVADSNTAIVIIKVTAVNDAPVVSDVTATIPEDTAVTITLLGSDGDTDDTLTYSIVNVPSKGTLGAINGSTVVYTPSEHFNGEDTFTYKASDGVADSNTATVTITVNAVNDAPVVSDVTKTTDEDTAVEITLSGSDVDTDDTLTYSIVNVPSKGTLGAINGSTVVYTPSEHFNGEDTFTYKASDGAAVSNTATVTINVNPVNDAPIFTSDSTLPSVTTVTEDVEYSYTVTTQDVDASDTVTLQGTTIPSWLTLTNNGDGTALLSGKPTNDDVGVHQVVITATDGTVSITQEFTITVSGIIPVKKGWNLISAPKDNIKITDENNIVVPNSKFYKCIGEETQEIDNNQNPLNGKNTLYWIKIIPSDETSLLLTYEL